MGMSLVWASATGRIQLSYTAMIIAAFVFANSNACIDTVSLAANVANWPNDRGSAAGVMKAAVGLCPSIFGILYVSLHLTAPSYLVLCILVPSLGCILLMPLVNEVPWIQKCELMPHGLFTTPSRFIMAYQVRSTALKPHLLPHAHRSPLTCLTPRLQLQSHKFSCHSRLAHILNTNLPQTSEHASLALAAQKHTVKEFAL